MSDTCGVLDHVDVWRTGVEPRDQLLMFIHRLLSAYLSSQGDDITWLSLKQAVHGHMCFFWLSTGEIQNDWFVSLILYICSEDLLLPMVNDTGSSSRTPWLTIRNVSSAPFRLAAASV